MKILVKEFGKLRTNCYILIKNNKSLIIDPGEGSEKWVLRNIKGNALAILNTHAHYDHVMGNGKLQKKLSIPLIIHQEDIYLLKSVDEWQKNIPKCIPTYKIHKDVEMEIGEFKFKIIHLPGHTLGTCIYDFGSTIFSGDFVMKDTIGRYNLFTSDKDRQYASLNKFISLYKNKNKNNIVVYPGHDVSINIKEALNVVEKWIKFF